MVEKLTLRYVKLLKQATTPTYAHGATEDAGMDLCAAEQVVLPPGQWKSVRTGLCVDIPQGYDGQVRPRSGLALKHGVTLLNTPGTIDPGYRGELRPTLINFGSTPYTVRLGDRIAQLIIGRCVAVRWQAVESLQRTSRGNSGFGSTGR